MARTAWEKKKNLHLSHPFFFPLPPSLHHFSSSSQSLTSLSLSTPTFILPEIPALPLKYFPALYSYYQRTPLILRYLRALTGPSALTLCDLSVSCRPSASDHKGRLNPVQLGAAKLPKLLRTLLFGATHVEIELVGSHYQLFQRFHLALGDTALPTVQQLRRLLSDDMSIPPCTPLHHRPKAPKDLPTHLLNLTPPSHRPWNIIANMDIIPHPRLDRRFNVLTGPNPQCSPILTPSSENVRLRLSPLVIWHFTFWSILKPYGCVISLFICTGTILSLA